MSLILYGVCERGPEPPPGQGLGGRPLRPVTAGDLTAIVSEAPDDLAVHEGALRIYARVVESLEALGTVLPARFGTRLANDQAATRLLVERRDRFVAALARVQGAAEMGIRATAPLPEPSAAHGDPGRAYLLGRLEQRRRAEQLAARIDQTVSGVVRQSIVRVMPRSGTLLQASYLVTRDAIDTFAGRIAELGEFGLAVTGPWPPYSFVESA